MQMKATTERRLVIIKTLCDRRYETIDNLAFEFSVNHRIIRRNIAIRAPPVEILKF